MSDALSGILSRFTGQGGQSDFGGQFQEILAQQGGIGGLVSRFQNAGLGDAAQSWVSNGPNQPIGPEHVEQTFGSEQIQEWANKLGIPPEMTSTLLAQALPALISHFTPNGEVPANEPTEAGAEPSSEGGLMGLLRSFLGR